MVHDSNDILTVITGNTFVGAPESAARLTARAAHGLKLSRQMDRRIPPAIMDRFLIQMFVKNLLQSCDDVWFLFELHERR